MIYKMKVLDKLISQAFSSAKILIWFILFWKVQSCDFNNSLGSSYEFMNMMKWQGQGMTFPRIQFHNRLTYHFFPIDIWQWTFPGITLLKSFCSLSSPQQSLSAGWVLWLKHRLEQSVTFPGGFLRDSPKPGPPVWASQTTVTGTAGHSTSDSFSFIHSNWTKICNFPPFSMDHCLPRRECDTDLQNISLGCIRENKMVPLVSSGKNTKWNLRKHPWGPWIWRLQMPGPGLTPE